MRATVSLARPSSVLGPVRSTDVQRTAPIALIRRPLAGRAFAGLGPTPLAGLIGAKAEIVTFLEPNFSHLKTYRCLGDLLYPIIGGSARVGWFRLFQNLMN